MDNRSGCRAVPVDSVHRTRYLSVGGLSKYARHHLGRFHQDDLTYHIDHELIDTGPYRYVRHPLYVATICAFLGVGLCLGTWLSLALVSLPVAGLIHRIRVEEALLVRALGPRYLRYADRTSRLVPRVW